MTKRLLAPALAIIAVGSIAAQGATAKGVGAMAAPGGVTVNGSPYRYASISPGFPGKLTVVMQIDRDGGRVGRWWHLPGDYFVPAVAYDRSAGGLSADGRTLVLSRFTKTYPPRTTELAILDTRLHLRHPRRAGQSRPRHAVTRVSLRGDFSFDAISPDGSTIYLIHRYLPPSAGGAYISTYEVRALDAKSGKLLPEPIVDPDEPDEKMQGLPVTRASSPDGRWAYTLYDGNGHEPFIHALDTVGRRAVCIDLPQLEGRRNLFMLALAVSGQGRNLTVLSRPPALGRSQPLLTVDTKTFEVREPVPDDAESTIGLPWLFIGVLGVALGIGFALVVVERRTTAEKESPERA